MTIFDLAWKIIFIYIVGDLVIGAHFLIHGIPLSDIPATDKIIFLAGILIVIFSQPIYQYFFKDKIRNFSPELSVIVGAIIIFGLLQVFPVGIPYGKMLIIDEKTAQIIEKDDKELTSIINKVEKEGEEIIFLERKGFYLMKRKENKGFKESTLPYVTEKAVKEIRYSVFLVDIPGQNKKILVFKNSYTEVKNLAWFLLSIAFIYALISIIGEISYKKRRIHYKTALE
ncbi:hypothetical protein [Persephonella sp. KM09-Lau-8]|uniref:hypothetical protein n=1 Tax=Persephonella sp. KM09-Lau-8 TaxID=1158345 RepID=UPI0004969264|nr:hypothetical protein [Persephonella sp. KM09-Lau-8]